MQAETGLRSGYVGPAVVVDRATRERIFALRAEVWRETLGATPRHFPAGGWSDAYDEAARHWVIRSPAGQVVAAARCSIHARLDEMDEGEVYLPLGLGPGPYAAPARVVVSPAHRGQGLAQRLLDAQDEFIERSGARYALRQASAAMARLLERRGWQLLGEGPPDARFPDVTFRIAVRVWPGRPRNS